MLSVTFSYCHAECHYAKCYGNSGATYFATVVGYECKKPMKSARQFVFESEWSKKYNMLSVIFAYGHAECRHAKCCADDGVAYGRKLRV